eukprot:scaffold106034_cov63-Phaeocystis_antarctica.AAC.1
MAYGRCFVRVTDACTKREDDCLTRRTRHVHRPFQYALYVRVKVPRHPPRATAPQNGEHSILTASRSKTNKRRCRLPAAAVLVAG